MFLKSQFSEAPVHGFFTRQGGVSQGIYESLNVGSGSKDDAASVSENRRRATEALGFAETALLTPYQIHSPRCVYVSDAGTPPMEADAYVTDKPGLLLGVITADCLPVLMWDSAGVIAAAHAGWRGALAGILDNTVACMEEHGGKAENIRAVIGPAISAESYQVQEDFYQTLLNADKAHGDFFTPDSHGQGYRFDLPHFACRRLRNCGIRHIEVIAEDTLSQAQKFFSYRRACHKNEKDYGRQLSAVGL